MTSPSMKAALRYGLITRSGRTVTDADRKCFVATAAAPAPQNGGTRCVFGVPPALQNVSSGAARYAEFRTYEISLLLRSRAGFAKCWRLHPPEAAAPGGLANASRPHSQLCTREALPDPLIPAGPACTGQSPKTAQSAARGQLITTFYCHTYLPAL